MQTIPIPLNLIMQPLDTFGFFIQWTGNVYPTTNTSIPTFTDGTVTIIADATCAYTGSGTTPTFTPRQINGGVIYNLNTPCAGAPTAGTALGPVTICPNQNFSLSLTGQSQLGGLDYQWMSAPTSTGPWAYIAGGITSTFSTSQTVDTYYSCEVTCTNSMLADTSLSIFVTTQPNLAAGTYTIGAAGDYPNFNAAVAAMSCGIAGPVIFNVISGSGPYNEQIEIPQIIGASATNTIIFNGNGETLTFSATASPNNYIIRLNGADYITFDSLNIVTQAATDNFAVHLINDADYNTINNCTIDLTSTLGSTATSNAGIAVSGSLTSATVAGASGTNNIFTNNTIIGGYYGITINGASTSNNSMINTISNNTVQDFYYYGMYLRNISNSNIKNNDIHRINRTTVSSFYAMYFVTSGERNVIEANQIHDAFTGIGGATTSVAYVIYHSSVDAVVGNENKVVNNLIYNINSNGTIYALYNVGSDGVYYYHNTISLDDVSATGGITRGFYQTTTAAGIVFKNNIVSVTRTGTGNKNCLYFNATASTIISNNNVLYLNSPAGTNGIGWFGANQASLTDWQLANGGIYDSNSVDVDPMFANPSSGQFSPVNPAVDNIGAALGVLIDFYGSPRSVATPDPGAIEFMPPACAQPSNLIVLNLTGTTADLSWTENGTATTWDIEWDTAGFTPTGLPTITGTTTNPQSLTGLTPLTNYDFYVRADCGATESLWSGPYSFSTLCATQLAGTYTIGTAGNYLTFTDAVNDLLICGISAPVVFNVISGSGPFNEQITITPVIGASAINTVTFNGNGETITFATTTSPGNHIIRLNGADHITFDSLNIVTQSVTNNFAVHLINDADSNTFNNCMIDLSSAITSTSTSNAGIVVSGSLTSATTAGSAGAYNSFTNNKIIGGYYGITINGASSTSNSMNNIISNNTIEDFYYYGMYLRSISNSTINNNNLSRPARISVSSFYGMYFVTSGESNIIEANRLHDAYKGVITTSTGASYPIYHASVDAVVGNENKVINNLIYNINNNGTIYALYNAGSDGVFYYHNTISLDDQTATAGTTRGFYQTTLATGIEFKNNIISVTRGGTGIKHCIYMGTATTVIQSDNNAFYMNATAGTNNLGYLSGDQATLIDWQTASSGDTNSVETDPLFINLTNNDFTPGNPLIDGIADATVGVSTDIFGVIRAVTPDPGAIEFMPPTCPQPANLTTINVLSSSADLSWIETGSATNWDIEWGVNGFVQGTGTSVITATNPHNITGLTASTTYDFYVRAICGVGDTSNWSGPHTFTTLCNSLIAPWNESFENAGLIPNCWNQGVANAEAWKFSNTGSGNHLGYNGTMGGATTSGAYFAWVDDSSPNSLNTTLESPLINVSALTTPELSFYLISNNEGNTNVDFSIDVWDGTAWNIAFYTHNTNTVAGEWEKIIVNLSALTITGDVQFRFIVNETNGTDFYDDVAIDDVSIYEAPTCPVPSALSATNITTTSADLSWIENGAATTWNIEWGVSGFVQGTGTSVVTTTNPHNITGLAVNTTYDFYVRSVCGVGDSSLWVGLFTFTTPCVSVTSFPYFEDFETGRNCWAENNTGNGSWGFGTPAMSVINTAVSGINAFATGNLIGTYNPNENSMVTSPTFDFTNANNPKIEMKVWWNAEFSWDGAVLQSSIDGGGTWQNVGAFGDTVNWYTDNSVNGNPGGQAEGWSGRNLTSNGSGGWLLASHLLTGLNNQSNVILRIAFGSDGSVQDDGFAFDDVHIFDVVCPMPTSLGNDTIICPSGSVLLDAGAGYATYLWSGAVSSTSQTLLVDSSSLGLGVHTIYISVTDSVTGCLSRDTIVVEISTCIGVSEQTNSTDMLLFPNPNNGQFTINFTTQNTTDLQIRITNIQGQEVFVKKYFDNQTIINEIINIGNRKGVYFVNIISNNEVITKKIVVQ